MTDFGRPEEYEHLKALMKGIPFPVYMLVGNHDDAQVMRQVFPEHEYLGTSGPLQYSLKVGDIQLIALDTTTPQESFGQLSTENIEWLESELQKHSDIPVIIAMHHPPFKTLIGHMDQIGLLQGAEELKKVVMRYSNIERIICGHLHRSISVMFGNTIASTCPSPAHQVVLDLDVNAKSQWNLEPGGIQVHAWTSEDGLVSHILPVGKFDGPYPFHMDGQLID